MVKKQSLRHCTSVFNNAEKFCRESMQGRFLVFSQKISNEEFLPTWNRASMFKKLYLSSI